MSRLVCGRSSGAGTSAKVAPSREGVAQIPAERGWWRERVRFESGRDPFVSGSASRGSQGLPVELQKVVGCGDQAPFRAGGGPAPAFQAPDLPVRLDLAEDRLDHPQPP